MMNLCTNPSFEVDLAGWVADGTASLFRAVDPTSKFGSAYCSVGTTAVVDHIAEYGPVAAVNGSTYTASAWVRGDAGKIVNLRLNDGIGVTAGANVTLSATVWQRIIVTMVCGSTTMLIRLFDANGIGGSVALDGVQLELGSVATAYCDGDQPGCYWTGTPHASTSIYSFHVIDGGHGILPYLSVEIDVTNVPTNPSRVWTDVTPQIRQLTYTRSGRNDELQRTAPGTLSGLADNRGDVLTALGIKKAQWIRVRGLWAGVTYPRWQGIIETIPKQWPSAGHDATVEIHAADVLKVLRMYDLADETFGAQRNDQRVAALAALAGVTTSSIDTDTDAADAIATPIVQGSDALAMLISIEESENGLAIAEPDGTLSFQGRHWRLLNSGTPIATLGEGATDIPYRDSVSLEDDDQRIANIVSVTPAGGSAVVVSDAASKALYWDRRLNRDLLTSDTGIAGDAANYLLGRYKDPSPRIPSIEPIMASRTSAWPAMLAAGNSNRVTWTRAATTPLSEDAYIEQIAETVIPGTDWQMTLQLSPAIDEAGWVAGVSLAGIDTVAVY